MVGFSLVVQSPKKYKDEWMRDVCKLVPCIYCAFSNISTAYESNEIRISSERIK